MEIAVRSAQYTQLVCQFAFPSISDISGRFGSLPEVRSGSDRDKMRHVSLRYTLGTLRFASLRLILSVGLSALRFKQGY